MLAEPPERNVRVHPTAVVDQPVSIGPGTRIWHFCHIMAGARIGSDCTVGQGCFIAASAVIGNRVKLQNHVSVFDGVVLEDEVFCGPSSVFTNVKNPRAAVSRRLHYARTLVRRGATIGANATILPDVTIGEHSLVGAGATVTRDVPAFTVVLGSPARAHGWVSREGHRLKFDDAGHARCPATGELYRLADGVVIGITKAEDDP